MANQREAETFGLRLAHRLASTSQRAYGLGLVERVSHRMGKRIMKLSGTVRVVAASTLAIAIAGPAWASVCVDPDDASCEPTINAGIAVATAGDTVKIADGTYLENVVVNKSVTLKGKDEDEDDVVIRAPDGAPGIRVTAPGVKLKYLTVRGPRDDNGIEIEQGGAGATIKHVTVVDVESDACIFTRADGTTIDDSTIEACGGSCVFGLFSHDLTVEDTKIAGCRLDGVEVSGNGTTIEESKIVRVGRACVFVDGQGASVDENYVKNCGREGIPLAGCGIEIFGNDARVDRNRVGATLRDGICGVFSRRGMITRNRARATLQSGIFWIGEATIEENDIYYAGSDGIRVVGADFRVRYNEVEDSGGSTLEDCYAIAADDSTFSGNEAEECPDDGFGVTGNRNTLFDNLAEDNAENGFEVTGNNNRLEENEGDDNGRFDLCDVGSGTTLDDNDFGTQAFAACVD